MKYMVMECHPGYAVVLSDDGRFLKVANMRYEVGQTVASVTQLQPPEIQQQPKKQNSRRWLTMVAAAAACLVLTVTGLFRINAPYASVYMTINPEVRIDVNRSDSVVGVEGMNTDGSDLLEGYDYKHKDLELVMDELVDRAIDMGYLHEGGTITLNLDADETWVADHETVINDHLSDHLNEKLTVTIDISPNAPVPTEQETHGGDTIVIPVGGSGYGDSAYGDDADDGDSAYGADSDDADDGDSAYDADSDEDDGVSAYDTDSDDGDSAYDADTDDDADDDDTPYAAQPKSGGNKTQEADSDTPYADDGQTDYDEEAEADEEEDDEDDEEEDEENSDYE